MVMKEGTQAITFRVPGELKLQIEIEAARQGRSVNNLLKHIVTDKNVRIGENRTLCGHETHPFFIEKGSVI